MVCWKKHDFQKQPKGNEELKSNMNDLKSDMKDLKSDMKDLKSGIKDRMIKQLWS